jgi:transposase InsO family protein
VALSITMDEAFCVETLEEGAGASRQADIFNTDQDSQFTGAAFHRRARHLAVTLALAGYPHEDRTPTHGYGADTEPQTLPRKSQQPGE